MCAPAFSKKNAMKKNDCYKCPHREQVRGSAHSKCNALDGALAISISMKVSRGEVTRIDDYKGHSIEFHPHGVKMGWCAWPINFDPVWVECYLPIENNENQ